MGSIWGWAVEKSVWREVKIPTLSQRTRQGWGTPLELNRMKTAGQPQARLGWGIRAGRLRRWWVLRCRLEECCLQLYRGAFGFCTEGYDVLAELVEAMRSDSSFFKQSE